MTELEIEELEQKVTESDSVIVEEATNIEDLPDHVERHEKYFSENGSRRLG